MTSNWLHIGSQVWQRKKEWLLTIIGLALGIPFLTEGALWLNLLGWALTLLWIGHVIRSGIREIIEEEQEKPVPLMVIVGRDEEGYRTMTRQVENTMASTHYNLQDYKSNWQIDQRDIELYQKQWLAVDNPSAWQAFVQEFYRRVVYLDNRLPNRTVFHLFLNCPAILAFGLGARLDVLHEVILYHYQRGVDLLPYISVLDLSLSTDSQPNNRRGVRVIKQEAQEPYQFILVTKPSEELLRGSEVLVKLHLSGFNPVTHVEQLAEQNEWTLVHIDKVNPELATERRTWIRVTQEISTVLRQLATSVKRIHLCCNMPVALAFAVGMAMGTQSPLTLYQWNSADTSYYPVLKLETLREEAA